VLARLRRAEPVSWLPALNGWLVTRRDLAVRVMRDSGAFTVDDPRFSTARVVGPSMLSLDGARHARHRAAFQPGFSREAVAARLAAFVVDRAGSLVEGLRPAGSADLLTGLAGPLAVSVVARALGLAGADEEAVLGWYRAIVGAVSALTGEPGREGAPAGDVAAAVRAGSAAFASLSASLRPVMLSGHDSLTEDEAISNAAVLMFGGIETTEGMIANVLFHLLRDPAQWRLVSQRPSLVASAVEESLRLEPAAALVDRYATRDVEVGGASVRRGDLVSVSLTGAGRDPAVFDDPDTYDLRRPNARLHLAFAHGPHFCLGADLARLEVAAAVRAASRLPGLRLDPDRPTAPRGLVFRRPPSLHARWDRR
jgi:cytochrome P450